MALELWDRLRSTGLQPLAVVLFDHGVRRVEDILPNASSLLDAGAQAWQLEALIRGKLEVVPVLPQGRQDHPQSRPRKRASWTAALDAARPEKRQASLRHFRPTSWRPLPGHLLTAESVPGRSCAELGSSRLFQSPP